MKLERSIHSLKMPELKVYPRFFQKLTNINLDAKHQVVAHLNEDRLYKIGRSAVGFTTDVDLKSRDINKLTSRQHATLQYDRSAGNFIFVNIGKNGSRINGEHLKGNEQAHISSNTKIIIAGIHLFLRYESPK